jgi:hypothetical protein
MVAKVLAMFSFFTSCQNSVKTSRNSRKRQLKEIPEDHVLTILCFFHHLLYMGQRDSWLQVLSPMD